MASQIDLSALAERLANVERENRRIKRAGAGLLIILLGVGLLAVAPSAQKATSQEAVTPGVLEAHEFRLVDEARKTRAWFGIEKNIPKLIFHGENGKSGVKLGVNQDSPFLGFYDENGKLRGVLGMEKDGPALVLRDKNGKTRLLLGTARTTAPDGTTTNHTESSILLFDPEANVSWSAP